MEEALKIIGILNQTRKRNFQGSTPNIRENISTSKTRRLEQELDYMEGQRG